MPRQTKLERTRKYLKRRGKRRQSKHDKRKNREQKT